MGCSHSSTVHCEESNQQVNMAADGKPNHHPKREKILEDDHPLTSNPSQRLGTIKGERQLVGGTSQNEVQGNSSYAGDASPNVNLPIVSRTGEGFIVQRSPPGSTLPETVMPMTELFNLISAGYRVPHIKDPLYMLIVDSREHVLHERSHIITARHCSELDHLIESGLCKKYSVIVVYGESVEDAETKRAFDKINDTGLYVQIVEGGFAAFSSFAPFLCTDRPIRTEIDRRNIQVYPSVILKDALYQGNAVHAKSEAVIRNLRITHIVNVTTEVECIFQDSCEYLHLKFADENGVRLSTVFEKAADFIAKALEGPKARVLVHCVMGVSRSSSITISFLMKYHRLSFGDAYKYLKERRPMAAPNTGFIKQLSEYEQRLFGRKITDPDEVFWSSGGY